jgi:hypothetical protein
MSPRITRNRAHLLILPVALSLGSLFAAACTPSSAVSPATAGGRSPTTVAERTAQPTRPAVGVAAPADAPRPGSVLVLLPPPAPQNPGPGIPPLLAKVLPDPSGMQLPAVDGIPMTPQPGAGSCPAEMVLVDGEYCTDVEQTCIDWMEPPQPGGIGRCAKFAPSVCKGQRVHMKFCIDRDEYTPPRETLPENFSSWTSATETCGKLGKRLCRESEWNFACEGEDMLPYPTGYERASDKCNYDQMHLYDERGAVKDLRKPSGSLNECTSPFGVRNMAGNVDEWTDRDVTWGEYHNAMKGGWWMAARNRCRPATISHWDLYTDFQTGFRCCEDTP